MIQIEIYCLMIFVKIKKTTRSKPKPSKYLFSTSNFTSTLLNCFVLEHSDFKTKQLRSVLVKLLVLN
jgi:hypothetical protein